MSPDRARNTGQKIAPAGLGTLLLCLCVLLLSSPAVLASDLPFDLTQYAHSSWTVREGFSKGSITSIAQTFDGYLWLGTEFGLLRFDGVRNVSWQPPAGQHLPSIYIRSLLAAHDGSLWIGTAEGLASWKDGQLTLHPGVAELGVDVLLEDRDGTVWAGGQGVPAARLCSINTGRVNCFGQDGSLGQLVESLYEDSNGVLWVGASSGLWRWSPGPPKRIASSDPVQSVVQDDSGTLLVATRNGIKQLVDGKLEIYPLADAALHFTPSEILRDRRGALWIGTSDRGLVHLHQGRADSFAHSDGLSGDYIEKLFTDREGTVWVATLDGLDRFRDLAVHTISVKQHLSNATVESVLAATDGSVWLGTVDGLNRWSNGQITIYRKRSAHGHPDVELSNSSAVVAPREIFSSGLPDDSIESLYQDHRERIWVSTRTGVAYLENGQFIQIKSLPGAVRSFAGDTTGNLWISQDQYLFHLIASTVVERIPWTKLGRGDPARALVVDPVQGGLWIGFRDGGVAYFKDGHIRASYDFANGLAEGHIRGLQFDSESTLWAAVEGGLSRVKDGRVTTLTSKNGLPCDAVHWVMEDQSHSFWLYMACGLARIDRKDLDAWASTADHDPLRKISVTTFDNSDGVRSHATTTGYSPSIARSTDGKLWFLPWDGVSVIDPLHLSFNDLPPPVKVEQIVAAGNTFDASSALPLRLPPLVRDLQVDYTALSLVAPEKVFFRFKLEGFDRDWQDVGNRRQAFYTNLPPRYYRFRVAACNNSAVWNEAGAFLDFSIAPAYYQTSWFRVSCLAVFLLLLGALHQLRLRQQARQFEMLMKERVNERTRIAQELHDTLLQGFLSASMQLHVVDDQLAVDSTAKPLLGRVLKLMSQVIEEGRNAVRGLRVPKGKPEDLEQAFLAIRTELGVGQGIAFRVVADGVAQPLRPGIREDFYRIGREALVNAFRHSSANLVELEIEYSSSHLRLLVRDDGKGIDPQVIHAGRDGHWGLSGMRERAERIGARFRVLSALSAGTEIELSIPAPLAFELPSSGNRRGRPLKENLPKSPGDDYIAESERLK